MNDLENEILNYLEQIKITPKDCVLKKDDVIGYYIESKTLRADKIMDINFNISEIEKKHLS